MAERRFAWPHADSLDEVDSLRPERFSTRWPFSSGVYEVEVKVEAAHDPVRERLADLVAEPLGTVRQCDTYYDHPSRSFAETDEALRIRRESVEAPGTAGGSETTATLTYKGPLVDDVAKTREEVETGVDDPAAADAVLRAVGFEPAAEVEKERERFACDGHVVALDSVGELGEFVEVEAEGKRAEVEVLRNSAFELCRRLDLDPDESIQTSYLALLLDDGSCSTR